MVAAAGVSRATLYGNFSDKAALLAAVIADQSQRIATDDWATASRCADVETALTELGDNLLRFVALPSTFAFERLIGQAALENPEHGRLYFEAGPARVRRILATIVRRGQQAGTLRPADAEQAADDLIGLWQGTWRLEVAYGGRPPPDDSERTVLSQHGVQQFLALYAVR